MIKRMFLMILIVAIIVGGMIGFKIVMAAGMKRYLAAQPVLSQVVSTIKAESSEWSQVLAAVGSVRAAKGASLAFEVAGIVESLSFDSGAEVEEGTVLAHLRDDDDMARLRALEAAAHVAALTVERDLKQLKGEAISRAAVDNDKAALSSARAQVDAQRAAIEKKVIRAPFKGRLGIREIDVGQFLNAGTPIVTLQQLDEVYVDFNVPERYLSQISVGQKVVTSTDADPENKIEGAILALNAKIDEATRNIRVRAAFKNPDAKLLPGMFARVSVVTGAPQKYLTLPQTAITYNPYGDTVYIAAKDDKGALVARQTFVTLGVARGDQVVVTSGVSEGDEVVTAGQMKLRNGTPLTINNDVLPKNDANPKPEDK